MNISNNVIKYIRKSIGWMFFVTSNPEDNPERNKCYIKVDHCATYEPINGKCTECANTYTLILLLVR